MALKAPRRMRSRGEGSTDQQGVGGLENAVDRGQTGGLRADVFSAKATPMTKSAAIR